MTFEEQFSRIQQMFDNSGCDIIVRARVAFPSTECFACAAAVS